MKKKNVANLAALHHTFVFYLILSCFIIERFYDGLRVTKKIDNK